MQGWLLIEIEGQELEVWFQISSHPDFRTCRYCQDFGQRTVSVEAIRIEDSFIDWSQFWRVVEEKIQEILLHGSGFCTIAGTDCEKRMKQELSDITVDHRGNITSCEIV